MDYVPEQTPGDEAVATTSDHRRTVQTPQDTWERCMRLGTEHPAVNDERERVHREAMTTTENEATLRLGFIHTEAGDRLAGLPRETGRSLGRVTAEEAREPLSGAHLMAERAQQRRPHSARWSVERLAVLVDEGEIFGLHHRSVGFGTAGLGSSGD